MIQRVYINVHPDYDYSTAIIGRASFVSGLPTLYKTTGWLSHTRDRELMVHRKDGTELEKFIHYCQFQGIDVYTRNKRGEEWKLEERRNKKQDVLCSECKYCEADIMPTVDGDSTLYRCSHLLDGAWVEPENGCGFGERRSTE